MRTADALTAVRYICTPIVMWLIFSGHVAAALCVYALALVTDVLDGHFARRSGVISWYGATFDGLADILLVYGTIVALVVTGGAFWLLVGAIAGVAYLVPVLGLICLKKRGPSIPHLDTSLLAVSVHATIMAHVVGWPHAEFLLPFLMLVLVYYAHKYLAYARSIQPLAAQFTTLHVSKVKWRWQNRGQVIHPEGQIGKDMETAVTAFSAVWCVTVLFFIYRMWEAHKLRIGIMKEDLDVYMRLPSYSEMVFKFWRPLSWFVEQTSGDKPEEAAESQD